MLLLRGVSIRKHFGVDPVLNDLSFEVYRGERIGLVGPNGCGKTTLLRILSGKELPDSGEIERAAGLSVGMLEQESGVNSDRTVWEEAESGLAHVIELQQEAVRVAEALGACTDPNEQARLAGRYERLQDQLHHLNGYDFHYRVEQVLEGLGFRPSVFGQAVRSLSGGEQNRLALARLLLFNPELLLLDEPSNHLDLEATTWLEEFLCSSAMTVIVVSHDRYFLDKVTTRTWELYAGRLESYRGNFSAYRRQKAERILVERRAYEKQQREIAKAEEFIRRNFYGQKHAQAEDRRKKLERMQRLEPPREITGPPMSFPDAPPCGQVVLRVEGLTKSFQENLFADLTFDILRGQRWAILGPNGSGKTTLLKCLLGLLEPDSGRVILGHGVKPAYFDQHLLTLSGNERAVDAVLDAGPFMEEPARRDLLAKFGVCGDAALQMVSTLSGGQRCRVALAKLAAAGANLLVLDEPTNHLDLWAREALQEALKSCSATVIFVSHDRHFIDQVVDHLIVLGLHGRARVIPGNYSTYQYLVRGLIKDAGASEAVLAPGGNAKPRFSEGLPPENEDATASEKRRVIKPTRRRRKFPYRKLEDLEREILERETRSEQLLQMLTDPAVLRDGERVRQVKAELEEQKNALQTLYAHWEEAVELDG